MCIRSVPVTARRGRSDSATPAPDPPRGDAPVSDSSEWMRQVEQGGAAPAE